MCLIPVRCSLRSCGGKISSVKDSKVLLKSSMVECSLRYPKLAEISPCPYICYSFSKHSNLNIVLLSIVDIQGGKICPIIYHVSYLGVSHLY